jgi:predicted aspartyl protease
MIIRLPIRFEGSVGEKTLYGLFDTGATFSCIHPDYAEAISEPQRLFRPLEIETADKGRYMKITEAIRTDFYINDI